MKITPLGDQVLVLPESETEKVLKSGIVLPGVKKVSPTQAKVVAVGADVDKSIRPGQRIIFQKFQGETIKYEEQEYIVMPQKAIIAVVGEEVGK
jgi:chaperonin GroES